MSHTTIMAIWFIASVSTIVNYGVAIVAGLAGNLLLMRFARRMGMYSAAVCVSCVVGIVTLGFIDGIRHVHH